MSDPFNEPVLFKDFYYQIPSQISISEIMSQFLDDPSIFKKNEIQGLILIFGRIKNYYVHNHCLNQNHNKIF